MASKKGFKPPVKKQGSSTKAAPVKKDGAKPLSDSQYEKIFDAVLDFQGNRSPVQAESTKTRATEPGECASTGNSQSSQADRGDCAKVDSETQVSASTQSVATQVSALTESVALKTRVQKSTDSNCSSVCAAGVKPTFKRPNTLREALKVQESSSQFSSSLSQLGTGSLVLASDAVLSQAPKHFRHRQRLQWLQDRRGGGMYIQCDNCTKWRWSDIDDPVDVPKKWTCRQNEDANYNACHIPEQPISVYIEEDLIHNEYTAGSIVWAKLDGYPWWPAMVDDCPDTEQYYWLDGYSDIPTHYHVVFFDYESNEIGRSWLAVRDLISFKHQPALDSKFSLKPGHKSRISCAKVQAQDALKFRVKERLRRWSFLARWTGEIVTPPASDSELQETASAKGKGGVKKRKRRSQKEQSREEMGDSSDEEDGQPEGRNKGKKSARAKKNREDSWKDKNMEEADREVVGKKLRADLDDGAASQNSVSDQSFEEITLQVAEIVGEPVCSEIGRNMEEEVEDYTSAEAAEEVREELRQAEAAEDVEPELPSAEAATDSEDEDTQMPQPVADEEDSSMMDPVHTYSQDSSMEAFPLEESDAEDEEEPKLQQYMTQTLGQQVSIFETSAQSVSEEEDEQLKLLQEHISRSQNVEPTTPAKLTAKDVNVTGPMRVEEPPGSRGTKRQTGTDKDAAGMKKRARKMGAKDGQDDDDNDEEMETGKERKGNSGGKENSEKWEKRKIGKKLNMADFALKRRRSKDGEGKRGKMARSDGKTGAAGGKGGTSARSDSRPAKGDSKDGKSDSKPAKDAKSDSKLGKSDTKDARGESKPAKDTKDAKGDSKDAKSDTKDAESHNKDAKIDSKPAKVAKSDNKLAKDTKHVKGDSKDAKSDSKSAKSDNKSVKDAKSDSKPAKSDTKDAISDSKPTKGTKDAKDDSKDAKSDSKLAKSDTKDAKSDNKDATIDSKPAKDTKSGSRPVKRDCKDAKSDSKPAKDTKTAESDSKPAKSDSKLAKDAKSDSKPAKDTKLAKSDTKITKSDKQPAKSDSKLAKKDTKVATDDTTATSDSKIAKSATKVAKGDTKLARDTKPAKSDTKPSSIDTTKPSTSGLNNPTQKRSKKTKLFQPPVRKPSTSESAARSESHSEPQSHPPGSSEQPLDLTSSQSLSSSVAVVPNSEDRLLDILNRLSQESLPFDP